MRRGITSRLWSLSVTWMMITGSRQRPETSIPRRETRRAPSSQEHIVETGVLWPRYLTHCVLVTSHWDSMC